MLTLATKESYSCGANYYYRMAKTLSHAVLDVAVLAAKMLP